MIIDFLRQLSAEDLSLGRQLKYLFTLKPIVMELDKDLALFDKKDIVELLDQINTYGYKENT